MSEDKKRKVRPANFCAGVILDTAKMSDEEIRGLGKVLKIVHQNEKTTQKATTEARRVIDPDRFPTASRVIVMNVTSSFTFKSRPVLVEDEGQIDFEVGAGESSSGDGGAETPSLPPVPPDPTETGEAPPPLPPVEDSTPASPPPSEVAPPAPVNPDAPPPPTPPQVETPPPPPPPTETPPPPPVPEQPVTGAPTPPTPPAATEAPPPPPPTETPPPPPPPPSGDGGEEEALDLL